MVTLSIRITLTLVEIWLKITSAPRPFYIFWFTKNPFLNAYNGLCLYLGKVKNHNFQIWIPSWCRYLTLKVKRHDNIHTFSIFKSLWHLYFFENILHSFSENTFGIKLILFQSNIIIIFVLVLIYLTTSYASNENSTK